MTNLQHPLRVLHCPTAIGGHPPVLAQAERELGLDSVSIVLRQSSFGYRTDSVLLRHGEPEFMLELRRWGLLWRAMHQFDVIHFNFGRTIAPVPIFGTSPSLRRYSRAVQRLYNIYGRLFALRDLPLLKRMGKAIFVTFQGDDLRQGDYCRQHFEISPAQGEVEEWYYTDESDRFKRWMAGQYAKYADRIYALNPDLLYLLSDRAKFMAYANVDPRYWKPVEPARLERLTVLHAPSHRGFKGTRHILEAVRRLQEEDRLDFEFILVENITHKEAVEVYKRADLLVDQILAGWYGGLAVELMALGKAVMCYLREEDLKFIPPEMKAEMPIINATPYTLYDTLKLWLTARREELPTLGQRGRAYIERWHDPLKIAANLRDEYESVVSHRRLVKSRE